MKKLAVALTLGGAVIAGGTAHAQEDTSYNTDNPRGPTLSASIVAPGDPFTVTVGCLDGESITFDFEGTTTTVACQSEAPGEAGDLDGSASADFTAPSESGSYTGSVDFPTAPQETFTITVQSVSATTDPSDAQMPATGSSGTGPTVATAAVLLVAGACMLGMAHRRRRETPVA